MGFILKIIGFIFKIFVGLILLGIVIRIFEKVTGINITGDSEKEDTADNIKSEKEEKVYSPLEMDLKKIKSGSFGRAKEIAKYVIPLYSKPYAEIGNAMSSASIETIVSKYLDNQFLFSEEYENHVIELTGEVGTIGKDGENVYISFGDGSYYHRSGTSGKSVKQHINCYIDKADMEDDNYRNIVRNMRPGVKVTVVGVLCSEKYGSDFKLFGSTLIEVGGVVPDKIMNIAVDSIYKKHETRS